MAKEFKLPDLGEGLSEATLVGWKVKEGEVVKSEQVLAEVETDKAMTELPSPFAGKVTKLHFKAGDTVPVGATLVSYDAADASASAKSSEKKPAPRAPDRTTAEAKHAPPPLVRTRAESASRPETRPTPAAAPASVEASTRPVLAAPATRKLAREHGIDIRNVRGTGPGGRITTEDVLSFASAPAHRRGDVPAMEMIEGGVSTDMPMTIQRPMLPDFSIWGQVERQKASAIRKRIAQRMMISTQTTASVTHMDEADVTSLEESRQQAQDFATKKGIKLTMLPFVLKAVVAALKARPIFNASYDDDKQEIVYKKYFHIGIAVDSPQGLLVPVIRDVDKKTISEIARDLVGLAGRARDGKITAEEMRGGSFTITNIGAIGGIGFTPVINWPEVAILGLGRTQDRPAIQNNTLVNRKKLPLCLSFDHRVIDGADAARFVNDIKLHIENPLLALLEM